MEILENEMDERILRKSFMLGYLYGYNSGYDVGFRDSEGTGIDEFYTILESYEMFDEVKEGINSIEIEKIIEVLENHSEPDKSQ